MCPSPLPPHWVLDMRKKAAPNKMKLRSQDLHRFKSRLQPQVKPKEPQCCLQTDLHMKRQKMYIYMMTIWHTIWAKDDAFF